MKRKLSIAVVFIIIVTVAVGVYYVTLPSPPTAKVSKRLQIVSDISYVKEVDNRTVFVVTGIVQNNLTTNVESVNVTVTFFDAANKTIRTDVSRSQLQIIKVGGRSPFQEVSLLLGSSEDVPERYEFSALGFETNEEPIEQLEITRHIASFDENGYHKIAGEVQNKGNRKAFTVKVICAYYESGGNLIDMSWTGVSSAINAGQTEGFELRSSSNEIVPARYELFVVVLRWGSLVIANYVLLAILIGVCVLFVVYMKMRRGW